MNTKLMSKMIEKEVNALGGKIAQLRAAQEQLVGVRKLLESYEPLEVEVESTPSEKVNEKVKLTSSRGRDAQKKRNLYAR